MPLETFYTRTVEIKRTTYVGDKSSFVTASTVKGYLRPLSAEEASLNGFQHGQAFMIQVPSAVDLRKGDRVTIESKDYTVEGVANHDRFSLAHRRALITLPQPE